MQHIARLLEIPGQSGPPSPAFVGSGIYSNRNINRASRENRPLFNTSRGPGFAAPRRESTPGIIHKADETRTMRREGVSPNRLPITNLKKEEKVGGNGGAKPCRSRDSSNGRTRSREGSPRMPRPRSEEIPLELIKKAPGSVMEVTPKITILSRPQTPRVEPEASTSGGGETMTGVQQQISSEETSFIGDDENQGSPKRGIVETV